MSTARMERAELRTAQALYEAANRGVTKAQFESRAAEVARSLPVRDVLDELYDVQEQLQVAIRRGDAELIGRIVLAVRSNYAERVASDIYETRPQLPTAQQVAILQLAGASS